MKLKLLSIVVGAVLAVGVVQAKEPAKADTAKQQETRAEIDRLVERIESLSRQLGDGADIKVIVRRGDGHAPRTPGKDDDVTIEILGDPGAHREVRIERIAPGAGDGREVHFKHRPGDAGKREVLIEKIEGGDFRSGPGLGIVMAPNPAASGVRIAAITPGSPAMKSGLRTGDVLLVVDGKSIGGSGEKAVESARALLGKLKQDQVVRLRYARQGKAHDASVKASSIPRMMVFSSGDGDAPMAMREFHDGTGEQRKRMMMLPPNVEMEIERIGPMHNCAPGDDDCGLPALFQAFRWQGLNLASLDPSLGRYFGSDKGVLVLSNGPDLKGLQPGDVIRRIGGSAVDSPREVMQALRDKDAGSRVQLDVLRDRKPLGLTVTVPKSRPLPFMAPPPPAPPAPPAAPRPPHAAPPALPAAPRAPRATPPAPPAPPAAPVPPPGTDQH